MSKKVHSHRSIMTDPVDNVRISLDLKRRSLRSPRSKSTSHNHENLSIENDPSIRLAPITSAHLKVKEE